jgi:hypothetical protein
MDDVIVFVDDAILGRLPPICIKHGDATADSVVQTEPVGASGLGILWLLLVLGPIGWIAAFILSMTGSARGERLTVKLPLCEESFRQNRTARRFRTSASAGATVLAIVTFAMAVHASSFLWIAMTALFGVAAVLAAAEWLHESRVCKRSSVGVSIDVSRRWVTLHRVHPTFKGAIRSTKYDVDASYDHPSAGPSPAT